MATRVLQLTLTMTEWAGNLGACIKLQTVSWNETSQNVAELQEMGRFLRRTFPAVFSAEFVQVGRYGVWVDMEKASSMAFTDKRAIVCNGMV